MHTPEKNHEKTVPDGFFPSDPLGIGAGAEVPIPEGPGSVIGRYKLLQQIGEGGFGVVYMAEQKEPVTRRVALKIIKLGMDTKQVIARFEAERQALALMDHPNIAKVLDAGSTDSGRPFFVMELVRGIPITEYCDKNHLSARERLGLFVPVCQAIQHAHQKGIIHRDIKPSNVLVTLHDGKPVPMVIDFGIAKATNQKLTEKTLFTNFASMIGTPAYMSPEQAEMTKLDVDTRSDIYSLGVLLYELLTGTTPFPEKRLRSVGFGEMQRIIAEEEPDRPSTRLSTMEAAQRTTVAKNRAAEVAALNHLFRGDLDWIVMKCLEKDRTRRYETTNGLALDIQRHLAQEPISARPPSGAYRFQKMVRRNKFTFSAVAAVASALIVGAVAATVQSVRASKAEAHARAQADRAMTEARRATEAEKEAQRERADAEASLYAAHMSLAQTELTAGNLGSASDLLNQHRPRPGRLDIRGWEWRYLWKLCRSDEEFTLGTHRERVQGVTFSPDGRLLLTADTTDSGDPDGSKVILWDFSARKPLLPALSEEASGSVAFSPDGRLLAFGTLRDEIKVFSISPRTEVARFPGRHHLFQVPLAFSPDSTLVAIGDTSGGLRGYDIRTGQVHSTMSGHAGAVTALSFFPNGQRLISSSEDSSLRVWDVATGRLIRTSMDTAGGVISVAVSPDGRRIVCVQGDGAIRVADSETHQTIAAVPQHVAGFSTIAFSPDGKTFACGAINHSVRVWDSADARELLVLKGSRDEVHAVAYSPDGAHLITGAKDGTVKAWSTRLKVPESGYLPQAPDEQLSTLSPNGKWMFEMSTNGFGRVTEVPGFQEAARWPLEASLTATVQLAISSDGTRSACGTKAGEVIVLNSFTGRPMKRFQIGNSAVESMKFSRDNKILVACDSSQILVCNTEPLTERSRFRQQKEFSGSYDGINISDDGKAMAVRYQDGRVAIFNSVDKDDVMVWKAHRGHISEVTFFPDRRRVLTAGADARLKSWDLGTRQEAVVGRALNSLSSAAFNRDASRVASGAGEGLIRIFDSARGYQLTTLPSEAAFGGRVRFMDDGNTLVSLGFAGLQAWRAPSWEEIEAAEKQEKAL